MDECGLESPGILSDDATPSRFVPEKAQITPYSGK